MGPHINIPHNLVNFSLFILRIEPLKIAIYVQVLLYCKHVEKNIMLRANAYDLAYLLDILGKLFLVHLIIDEVLAEAGNSTARGF